ncbi:MAG: LEA type 2 family protein [Methanomicrobiales archaeon]|nr:LEA type 2 family protein [Methanomicrobiales archaeon]MDI6875589.1 LEA type 2 family protein [Methanomicrobiales archaeon]
MRKIAAPLLTVGLFCVAGCLTSFYEEPAVTVEGLEIVDITPGSPGLLLHLNISNPNPLGATLDRVSFDLYLIEDGRRVFLGHGERGGFEIPPRGSTAVAVPVTLDNRSLIQALLLALRAGTVTIAVEGSATLDLGVTAFEVPFNQTTELHLRG